MDMSSKLELLVAGITHDGQSGLHQHADTGEDCKHLVNGETAKGAAKQRKSYHTRYFIIKSLNHHNIAKSIEKGIWATQAMNEPVLNEAYEVSHCEFFILFLFLYVHHFFLVPL